MKPTSAHTNTVYSMKPVFEAFNAIRSSKEKVSSFWDVVVLTTADDAQTEAFECQLGRKLTRGEIPAGTSYQVIADPPGVKVGSGGSTMFVLHRISQEIMDWESKKILIVHTGGQSKRLPLASALGKVFTALPMGSPRYDMLELILATFFPFARMMSHGGVFVAASDVLVSYDLGSVESSLHLNEGIVALSHPSTVTLGKGHGVYVLEKSAAARAAANENCGVATAMSDNSPSNGTSSDGDQEKLQKVQDIEGCPSVQRQGLEQDNHPGEPFLCECLKVLQKPTAERMLAAGAIIHRHPSDLDLSRVYTDSCFYMSAKVARSLADLYKKIAPLNAETCAYGDFLQPLGKHADDQYIDVAPDDKDNVKVMAKAWLRRQLYNLLKPVEFRALVLPRSRFYHIGTLPEYVKSFCGGDLTLWAEMGLERRVSLRIKWKGTEVDTPSNGHTAGSRTNGDINIAPDTDSQSGHDSVTNTDDLPVIGVHDAMTSSPVKKKVRSDIPSDERSTSSIKGCVINCLLDASSVVPLSAVLEHCRFPAGVDTGKGAVVSNCVCVSQRITVPGLTFIHTIPVTSDGVLGYITVAFGVNDNLKAEASLPGFEHDNGWPQPQLELGGHTLSVRAICDSVGEADALKVFGDATPSLWDLRAFPLCSTPEKSLIASLNWYDNLTSAEMCLAKRNGKHLQCSEQNESDCNNDSGDTPTNGNYKSKHDVDAANIGDDDNDTSEVIRLSLSDAVEQKDVMRMIEMQDEAASNGEGIP